MQWTSGGGYDCCYDGMTFQLRRSVNDAATTMISVYDLPSGRPLFCDFNGDGTKTLGFLSPEGRLSYSNQLSSDWRTVAKTTEDTGVSYVEGDTVFCGDFDGNGTDTVGRKRGANWIVTRTPYSGARYRPESFTYGNWGDIGVVGDWDGDGLDSPAVVRTGSDPHVVQFLYRNSNQSGVAESSWQMYRAGTGPFTPVVGDWDGYSQAGRYRDGFGVVEGDLWQLRDSRLPNGELDFYFGTNGDHWSASQPILWS